jgi:hypothetical protein
VPFGLGAVEVLDQMGPWDLHRIVPERAVRPVFGISARLIKVKIGLDGPRMGLDERFEPVQRGVTTLALRVKINA